jgi:cobalt-zinc-cadmium efflux system outer membrane protein
LLTTESRESALIDDMTSRVPRASGGTFAAVVTVMGLGLVSAASAQQPTPARLTLGQAIEAARRVQPDVRAAQEALAAATARERQASAYPNPTFSYGREQTSASGGANSQNIAAIEQRLEVGGVRSSRAAVARLRREAAAARLDAAVKQLDYETTRAYALALAADRRALLAEQANEAFARARVVSDRRLAAGDVSGYAHRRIRLEAARYAGARAEAFLARRSARLALAALITGAADSIASLEAVLADSLPTIPGPLTRGNAMRTDAQSTEVVPDSLVALALRSRSDLRALDLEADAGRAEARLTARERVPSPALSLGFKNERAVGVPEQANGFTAGVSLPMPLWDRRENAVAAADADSRRRAAEADVVRRRVVREVAEAYDGYRALEVQLAILAPELGDETRVAMRAVQVAYTEGEATVVEWLDAVRAYQEAEASFATLRAEAMIRRAALERALGVPLAHTTTRSGADASARK